MKELAGVKQTFEACKYSLQLCLDSRVLPEMYSTSWPVPGHSAEQKQLLNGELWSSLCDSPWQDSLRTFYLVLMP